MGSLGYRLAVSVAFTALLFGAGCKQILGLHERSAEVSEEDGGAGGTMMQMVPEAAAPMITVGTNVPLRYPSPDCAACMDAKCVQEAQACHADSSCDPLYDCFIDCGDDATCRSRCASFFSRTDAVIGITTCREKSCAAECANNCGNLNYNAPGCGGCVHNSCCQAASDCAKNPECMRLDVCRSNCLAGSTTCPPDCEAQHPDGVADYGRWLDCTQNVCGQACVTGTSWSCLDSTIVWPKPRTLGKIKFSVTVVDLLLEVPYAHCSVKACQRVDPLCANPLDKADADENGLVELTVPSGSKGFDGYLDITGGDSSGGDGGNPSPIFPSMWYPAPPIISGGWRGRIQFPSATEIPLLAGFVGTTIDPMRGHFAANAGDCNFSAAAHVTFETASADKDSTPFYFLNGNPDMSAHETDGVSAIGGYVNLVPGFVRITGNSTVANKTLGQQQFTIRPGTFTTSSFAPQPSN
jgi:hypothetical protein